MTRRDPAVAGMSGLCDAITLLRSGISNVSIYEKADEVGGAWPPALRHRRAAPSANAIGRGIG